MVSSKVSHVAEISGANELVVVEYDVTGVEVDVKERVGATREELMGKVRSRKKLHT